MKPTAGNLRADVAAFGILTAAAERNGGCRELVSATLARFVADT